MFVNIISGWEKLGFKKIYREKGRDKNVYVFVVSVFFSFYKGKKISRRNTVTTATKHHYGRNKTPIMAIDI